VVNRSSRQKPVVVGYDGSEGAGRALVRAGQAARGGEVVVVHATAPADASGVESDLDAPDANELVRSAKELLGDDVHVSSRLERTDPVEALVSAARDVDAGLIVVGARGGDFVARTLRGSVGERLVARAPCDLLIVR
jgi:nucleotide-binding universal stress UspA family protein